MAEERKYWDEGIETMPVDGLRKLQEERLQALVARAYEKTALYRRKFDEAGVKPQDIKTIDDLKKLPLTEYLKDFCQTPLSEKMVVPLEEVKVYASTSGTLSGFTQPIPFTRNDFEKFLDGEGRVRWTMGIRPSDVIQLLHGFHCCPIGIYNRLGATLVLGHSGRGNMDYQLGLIPAMGVTVLEHLPSLVLRYFERASEIGIDIRQTRLRLVFGVGEGWAESYKKKVVAQYGVPFRTCYGAAETPYGAVECEFGGGMHIFGDYSIVEIIDPETGKPLGPGEEGEVVVTYIGGETVPFIRYRMGDVARLLPYEPCPCGRTHPKLSMVKGRVAHITKVAGKRIMPIDVEEVVAATLGLGDEYQIVVDKPGELDKLKLKVEYRPEVGDLGALRNQVEEALYRALGIESEVELVEMGSIGRALFKVQRLITTYK